MNRGEVHQTDWVLFSKIAQEMAKEQEASCLVRDPKLQTEAAEQRLSSDRSSDSKARIH